MKTVNRKKEAISPLTPEELEKKDWKELRPKKKPSERLLTAPVIAFLFRALITLSVCFFFYRKAQVVNNNYIQLGLFGDFGIFILSCLLGYVCVSVAESCIWRKVGFFIANKKYNKRTLDEVDLNHSGCSCCRSNDSHIVSIARLGLFALSRRLVKKFICKDF